MEGMGAKKAAARKKRGPYKPRAPRYKFEIVCPDKLILTEEGGRVIAKMIMDFFKQPGVEEDFQRWSQTPEGMAAAE